MDNTVGTMTLYTNYPTRVDTFSKPVKKIQMALSSSLPDGFNITFKYIMFVLGSDRNVSYIPYTESSMQLPQTVELGKWDYIENGQIVKQTSQEYIISGDNGWTYSVGYNQYLYNVAEKLNITFPTRNDDDFISSSNIPMRPHGGSVTAGYSRILLTNTANLPFNTLEGCKEYFNQHPFTFRYKLKTPTITPIDFDNEYLVWDKGEEQVLTPEDENGNNCFDYGANTTEKNEYIALLGGAE
jgi:hypothetical protein